MSSYGVQPPEGLVLNHLGDGLEREDLALRCLHGWTRTEARGHTEHPSQGPSASEKTVFRPHPSRNCNAIRHRVRRAWGRHDPKDFRRIVIGYGKTRLDLPVRQWPRRRRMPPAIRPEPRIGAPPSDPAIPDKSRFLTLTTRPSVPSRRGFPRSFPVPPVTLPGRARRRKAGGPVCSSWEQRPACRIWRGGRRPRDG